VEYNNQIEFDDLPRRSTYGPIKNEFIIETHQGSAQEEKNHAEIYSLKFERSKNTVRCSEMVEVVE